MTFALTVLGVNSATPAHGRFPTSQYLQIQNHHFLIDCGEGAQMRMGDFDVPRHKIEHIFISHLHGDHIFGLPGLLFSFALNDRKKALHLHAPTGLEEMVSAQLLPSGELPYPLHFHELDTTAERLVLENDQLTVHSFPLRHRVPTCGFLFREKPFERNIRPEKITELGLSIDQIKAIKNGEDLVLGNGQAVPNNELILPAWQPRSYAFVSDTIFDLTLTPHIKGVNLLYHETTFCEAEKENAALTMHSTAKQAAQVAKAALVGCLITGHYSSRYKDLQPVLDEASAIFPETKLGLEGHVYAVERKREQKKSGLTDWGTSSRTDG